MASEIIHFDEGNPAQLTMTFTDPKTGNPVTPGAVFFHWQPRGGIPAATATVWQAGVDSQVDTSQQALGQYTVTLPITVTNGRAEQRYECAWESTGSWPSRHPFTIIVTAKNV